MFRVRREASTGWRRAARPRTMPISITLVMFSHSRRGLAPGSSPASARRPRRRRPGPRPGRSSRPQAETDVMPQGRSGEVQGWKLSSASAKRTYRPAALRGPRKAANPAIRRWRSFRVPWRAFSMRARDPGDDEHRRVKRHETTGDCKDRCAEKALEEPRRRRNAVTSARRRTPEPSCRR